MQTNGAWKFLVAGNFIELPPYTVHTFINNTEQHVVWITGWCPKGFDKSYRDFGIPEGHDDAQKRSVSVDIIQRVTQECERYAMCLSMQSKKHIAAYAADVELLGRIAGSRAADALRDPFVLGDQKKLAELFSRSGVTQLEVTTQIGTAEFPNIRTMVEADLRGWLPVRGVALTEDEIGRILQEAERVLD